MFTGTHFFIFLSGAVGGVFPHLIVLGTRFLGDQPKVPEFLYYIALVVFFFLGGVITLIFGETDSKKAFFLGVSLPALITSVQLQPDPKVGTSIPKDHTKTSFIQLVAPAHAQSKHVSSGRSDDPTSQANPNDASAQSSGKLLIRSSQSCVDCELRFYDKQGRLLKKQPFPNKPEKVHSFSIPERTDRFGIWNELINPHLWTLPNDGRAKPVSYTFEYKPSIWNYLRREGLGNYGVKLNNAEIRTEVPIPSSKSIEALVPVDKVNKRSKKGSSP